MLTRVVAKQAKTAKVKNKFVNGKKSSKEHSVVFSVRGEKFNLAKKIRRYSSGEKFKFALSVLFELGRHTA